MPTPDYAKKLHTKHPDGVFLCGYFVLVSEMIQNN
jgi:hypothetical protein